MIIQIAAVGKNNELGKDNEMLWRLPEDFKRFKHLTMGNYIVMGRKTFESLPGVLPGRTHIIITRQDNYAAPEDCIVVKSVNEALAACTYDKDVYIVGGGEIYKETLKIADKLELTKVRGKFDADTFYPKVSTHEWVKVFHEEHAPDEKHKFGFSFVTYIRSGNNQYTLDS